MRELSSVPKPAVTLSRLRRDPDLPRLALVLALVLLVQALLPLQTHTIVVRTATGVAVQVCTLHGVPVPDQTPPARDPAAMLFSQLAAELLPGALPVTPAAHWVDLTPRHDDAIPFVSDPGPLHARIRAPPAIG